MKKDLKRMEKYSTNGCCGCIVIFITIILLFSGLWPIAIIVFIVAALTDTVCYYSRKTQNTKKRTRYRPNFQSHHLPPERESKLFIALIRCTAKLAKIDGRVSREEADYLRHVFVRIGISNTMIRKHFNLARDDCFSTWTDEIDHLAQYAGSHESAEVCLTIFCNLVSIDGRPTKEEMDFIHYAEQRFGKSGFSASFFQQSPLPDNKISVGEAYKILCVSEFVSDEELKKSYRKLAAKTHPDCFAGEKPAIIEKATADFQKLSTAYEVLLKERGLKK